MWNSAAVQQQQTMNAAVISSPLMSPVAPPTAVNMADLVAMPTNVNIQNLAPRPVAHLSQVIVTEL